MPVMIPVTPDGARQVTVEVGGVRILFRTYYSVGQSPIWLLDLYDNDENVLITGLALIPGSDNIIKGQGDILNGFQLYVLTMDNNYTNGEALGNSLQLMMYAPGETNLYHEGDPLLNLGRTISL